MSHRPVNAMSPAALIVAVIALVLTAGVGYTAGKVGTADLANNAVTSPKVDNGSLKAADLVKEKKIKQPVLGNGGQNDCVWRDAVSEIPGLARVGYRTDRFGTTHLSGIGLVENGPGGDATCGGSDPDGGVQDLTIYTLPKSARPAASMYLPASPTGDSILLIPGPGGISVGSAFIPHGAVLCSTPSGGGCFMQGMSFPTKSSKVAPRSPHGADRQVTPRGRELLGQLFQR